MLSPPNQGAIAIDTCWERESRFSPMGVTGYVNHTPGQTGCPGIVSKTKINFMGLLGGQEFCFALTFLSLLNFVGFDFLFFSFGAFVGEGVLGRAIRSIWKEPRKT